VIRKEGADIIRQLQIYEMAFGKEDGGEEWPEGDEFES
jgi:hypothetical protein